MTKKVVKATEKDVEQMENQQDLNKQFFVQMSLNEWNTLLVLFEQSSKLAISQLALQQDGLNNVAAWSNNITMLMKKIAEQIKSE